MKIRNKSTTFLFGVLFLGIGSSMVVSATDISGNVSNRATQLGNNDGSASQNGLGGDNGSSTKGKLESQVNKEDDVKSQLAFVGKDIVEGGIGRSNMMRAIILGSFVTLLTAIGGAGIYFTKKKNVPGGEEKTIEERQTYQQQKTQDKKNNVQPSGCKGEDEDEDDESLELFTWIVIVGIIVFCVVSWSFYFCIKYLPCCAKLKNC